MLTGALARPHRRVLATIALGVLVAHALLLGGIDVGIGPGAGRETPAAPMQVREIVASVAPATAAPDAPTAVAAPVVVPRPRRAPRAVAPPADAAPALPAVSAAPPEPHPATVESVPEPARAAASQPEGPAPVAASAVVNVAAVDAGPAAAAEPTTGDTPPPTYPTRMPPAATLRYDLQRGRIGGSGDLRWAPDGERYALRLDGAVVGIAVLMQTSEGMLLASGLAPQRFTDQRARRAMQAANFDRAAHRVTFSGPSTEVPLHDGAQDRLSWMVQLAAIAAADAARREPGAKTAMQVVGARGDSSVWVFRCLGTETVETRAGPVEAVHVVREPRGPYDTGVEVWLDPGRHFLPLRATMRNGADGEVLELRLKDATFGS